MTDDNSERGTGVEWPTDATLYKLKGKIGSGAFATVWKATTSVSIVVEDAPAEKKNAQRQEECAIKVLNLDHVDSNLSEIRLEVQAMRLSSHPNVLACHAAFVHNTDLWLVTQLMRKGSSLHCLQGARKRIRQQQQKKGGGDTCPPPQMEDYIMYIVHETLLGLKYIHENGQIHRDIKAGNILLDSNGDVRIADFGVSGWLVNAGSQQERAKTFVGTPCWMVRYCTFEFPFGCYRCAQKIQKNVDLEAHIICSSLIYSSVCYCCCFFCRQSCRPLKLWSKSTGTTTRLTFGRWASQRWNLPRATLPTQSIRP